MLLNCHLLPLEKAWLRFSLCIVVLTLLSVGEGLAPPVVYKNVIAFCSGLSCCFASLSVKFARQTFRRQPLPICAIFVVSVVGAFFERPRANKVRPYGLFNGYPKIRL